MLSVYNRELLIRIDLTGEMIRGL